MIINVFTDILEPPRKISVYQDTTMDVTQLTLARRRGSSLTQEESFKKVGMIHFSTEYIQEEKIFQVNHVPLVLLHQIYSLPSFRECY